MNSDLLSRVMWEIKDKRERAKFQEEYHLYGSRSHPTSTTKGDAWRVERIRLDTLLADLRAVEGMC